MPQVIINNVELETVTVSPSGFPAGNLPEFAFVGRSNVGKSSLINAMINRKSLARTSQNPGKTRTINFYNVESKLYFVDLPGYGYAKAPKTEKQKWGKMVEGYLLKREPLRSIIMLVDIRHEPSADDLTMFEWLKYYGHDIMIVATKSDKLKPSQLKKHMSIVMNKLGLEDGSQVIAFSSETKNGRENLWEYIFGKCE